MMFEFSGNIHWHSSGRGNYSRSSTVVVVVVVVVVIVAVAAATAAVAVIITRQHSYRTVDRAMRPIYGCPEKFSESSLRTRLFFQKFVMDFFSDRC